MCSFMVLGPRTERGDKMPLGLCLRRIKLPARFRRRHPNTAAPVPGRGLASRRVKIEVPATLQQAIVQGHPTEWLAAEALRKRAEAAVKRAETGSK